MYYNYVDVYYKPYDYVDIQIAFMQIILIYVVMKHYMYILIALYTSNPCTIVLIPNAKSN